MWLIYKTILNALKRKQEKSYMTKENDTKLPQSTSNKGGSNMIRWFLKMELDSLSDVRWQRVPEVRGRVAEGSVKETEVHSAEQVYVQ